MGNSNSVPDLVARDDWAGVRSIMLENPRKFQFHCWSVSVHCWTPPRLTASSTEVLNKLGIFGILESCELGTALVQECTWLLGGTQEYLKTLFTGRMVVTKGNCSSIHNCSKNRVVMNLVRQFSAATVYYRSTVLWTMDQFFFHKVGKVPSIKAVSNPERLLQQLDRCKIIIVLF